jgi:RND family efflux transporter MFP subunit
MKKLLLFVVAAIVFAAGLYGAYQFGKQSGEQPQAEPQQAIEQADPTPTPEVVEPQAVPVRVAVIEQRDITQTQTFYGTAIPYQETNVQGKYGGKIVFLKANEGDDVKKGQTVVRFDDSDTQLQLQQATATKNSALERVKQAESDFETIQADLERQEELFKEGIVPQKTVDDYRNRVQAAQSALNTAREGVNQAESQIDLLNNTLKDLQITAPISGVVDEKRYSVNEIYRAGDVLYHILDIDRVYIEVEVPETYISLIKETLEVSVFFDSLPEQTFSGTIERIAPKGDPQSRSFLAKAVAENRERLIKPGMFARIQIVVKDLPQALVVDRKALVEENGNQHVVKIVDGTAQKIAVSVVHSDETSVALEGEDIQAGDSVVVDKAAQLQSGDRVEPL